MGQDASFQVGVYEGMEQDWWLSCLDIHIHVTFVNTQITCLCALSLTLSVISDNFFPAPGGGSEKVPDYLG